MVNSSRKETVVGGLTFLALVLAVMISYGTGGDQDSTDTYNVSAVFGRIDGLSEEAEVRLGGVLVGEVIATDLDENYRAVVTMGIQKGVPLPLDTSAAIHTDGIFGGKYIELEPGGEEEMMDDGDAIDMVQSSVVVEELLDLIIAEGKAKQAEKAQ